jgi:hypothetical protein
MAVTTMMMADQAAAFDEAKRVREEVYAESFEDTLELLITRGRFDVKRWTADLDAELVQVDNGVFTRTEGERRQKKEADDLTVAVEEVQHWIKDVRLSVRAAVRQEVEGASDLYAQVGSPEESYRQSVGELRHVLRSLAKAGDLERFFIEPGHFELGQSYLVGADLERAQLSDAQISIQVGADIVHDSLTRVAELMEELNDARDLAAHRLRRDLPGFDLRLIRAAVAPRVVTAPAPAATDAQHGL